MDIAIGPWVGEFGWEIVFSGLARNHCKGSNRVFASSFAGREILYHDFVDCFVPHEARGVSDCFSMRMQGGITAHDLEKNFREKAYDFFGREPDFILRPRDAFLVFNPFKDDCKKFGKYVVLEPGKTSPIFLDVVVHCRNRLDHRPECNWGRRRWQDLVDRLLSRKLTIAAIGKESFCPDGCLNFLGCDLDTTVMLMRSCGVVAGESSGPMHLASLVGTKRFVWGEDSNNAASRYEKLWNFHDSEVVFCGGFGLLPPVDIVFEQIIKMIRK